MRSPRTCWITLKKTRSDLPPKYRRRRIVSSIILLTLLAGAFFAARGVVNMIAELSETETPVALPPEPRTPPLDFEGFDPGEIISDERFYDSEAMDEAQVRGFIEEVNAGCRQGRGGTPCLAEYVEDSPTFPADTSCFEFVGAGSDTAAAIISKAATACGINPQVLLVMLQKEQGLLTASGARLSEVRYRTAMGYGCPDSAACDPAFFGFANQAYHAARQLRMYANWPEEYSVLPQQTNSIAFNPDPACGRADVFVENYATAALYNYTPYQPDAVALAGGRGPCASAGNLNFYAYFNAWFTPES